MLEFSDAPYQFFEARPSPFLINVARFINGKFVLPGKKHRITDIRIEGATDLPREIFESGDRLVFVSNHPSHSDPQIVTEVHRHLGVSTCFMAAYDVFLRGKLNAWCMQRLGNFSIDREGSDRKAMAAAIDTIKADDYALTIFPEGNVYLTNDRVTPFLDGTAFIALKAQQAIKDARVKIVPLSLKFTHLSTPRETVTQRLLQLGKDSGHQYDSADPIPAVMGLGAHLVSDYLNEHDYADQISVDPHSIFNSLSAFTTSLVSDIEKALEIEASEETALVDRIRKIRSKIHQIRTDESSDADPQEIDGLADKSILALRIHGYLTPYLTDNPTVDRYEETVERLAEDYYSRIMPRTGPRRATVKVGEPIDVSEILENAGGKLRNAVGELTKATEAAVQSGIDEINADNDAPGAKRLEEV
jgi:1-acyl-sn-glycerol-3-phosphate acyltransferase